MRIVLLLVAALALTDAAAQQQKPRPQLNVVVEDLDEDAAKCGFSSSQVESIAALTLRNNGVQAASESTNPYLYVRIAVLTPTASSCVFTMLISVRGYRKSDLDKQALGGFKSRKSLYTELCDVGGVVLRPRSEASTAMTRQLENYIKQCLGQLDY